MTVTRTFPIEEGIHGMNRLALRLNAAELAGQWHFAAGTRCDQHSVDIWFDNSADAELATTGGGDGGAPLPLAAASRSRRG